MVGNIYISDGEYNTKPKNPVFMAYRTSNYASGTSASVLVFNEEKIMLEETMIHQMEIPMVDLLHQ